MPFARSQAPSVVARIRNGTTTAFGSLSLKTLCIAKYNGLVSELGSLSEIRLGGCVQQYRLLRFGETHNGARQVIHRIVIAGQGAVPCRSLRCQLETSGNLLGSLNLEDRNTAGNRQNIAEFIQG